MRNPYIAGALELFIQSEKRYSGIPTMRWEMRAHVLREPVFEMQRGVFRVTFFNAPDGEGDEERSIEERLLTFCEEPRTRSELAEAFGFRSVSYFVSTIVNPLVEKGLWR